MRKLLLATAAIMLACAHAHAGPTQLPAEMLGPWCPAKEPSPRDALTIWERATLAKVKDDPGCMEVTRSGTRAAEDGCRFGRIDKRISSYIVYMRCWSAGDDGKLPLSATIYEIDGGQLKLWEISPCPNCRKK